MTLKMKHLLGTEGYDAGKLLDEVKLRLKLKNDAELSRVLRVTPPMISKIRHRTLAFSPHLMLRLTEISDLTYAEMRKISGEPDWRY